MIYNYHSDNIVQDIVLDNMNDLINDIIDEYLKLHRYENLYLFVPSDMAKMIINDFCKRIGKITVFEECICELDENENVLVSIDSDNMIYIESTKWYDNRLKSNEDAPLTYIYDGFSKNSVDELSKNGESILVFGFKDE